MKSKSIEWITRAWEDARSHAATILAAIDGQQSRAVVLANRRPSGAPSVMTLAALLESTRRFPAIVVVCPDLIEFDRVTFAEAIPDATIQVIDWCHPAPAEPADITLLSEQQLPRTAGTLAGYDAATIGLFTSIAAPPSGRQQQAIRSLLDSATDPLIVTEEWTYPDLLAAAVARLTACSRQDATRRVERWLQQPRHRSGRKTHPCPDGLLAVRDLAGPALRVVA